MKLKVEINQRTLVDYQPLEGFGVLVTPDINEDYWLLRVPVSEDQAVVCFPKVGVIGIGFQKETDWNRNLPNDCTAKEIFRHIKQNKGDPTIPDSRCVRAIELLKSAIAKFKLADQGEESRHPRDEIRPQLERLLNEYARRCGTHRSGAIRDVMTELMYTCDEQAIDHEDLWQAARAVYEEELPEPEEA